MRFKTARQMKTAQNVTTLPTNIKNLYRLLIDGKEVAALKFPSNNPHLSHLTTLEIAAQHEADRIINA